MLNKKSYRRSQLGLGMIDILVGMVIGLIGMLVIFQSFSTFEAQKRTTTTANDAQESGLIALTSIEREARLAGYGLYYGQLSICRTPRMNVYDSSSGVIAHPNTSTPRMLPVHIVDGAADANDTIDFAFSASGFGGTPSEIAARFDGKVDKIYVKTGTGSATFKAGDYILVGSPYTNAKFPEKPCARLQVSGTPTVNIDAGTTEIPIQENSTLYPANPPLGTLTALLAPGGYQNSISAKSLVVNLGKDFRHGRFSVVMDVNRNGRLNYTSLLRPGGTPVEIADGIVSLQAQYGVTATSDYKGAIQSWVNASGVWAAPDTPQQVARIKAVRIAVVARSQLMEKNDVESRDMTCTNVSGTNPNGPCAWRDTAANPAPTIDLSADPNWKRYRYRVYETVIPLRNSLWQEFPEL